MSQQPEALNIAINALQCARRGQCDHAMADEAIAALRAQVERLQAAQGQVVMPLAWMYHDGPSPDRIPSEMLGTVFVSLKRLPNYRNEIALVARSSTPAQEAADTGVDEREAFEAWARQQVWFQKHHLYRRDMTGSTRFGQYIQPDMELAWQSFRAALAARSGQVAAPAMVPLSDKARRKLWDHHDEIASTFEVFDRIVTVTERSHKIGLTVGGIQASGRVGK